MEGENSNSDSMPDSLSGMTRAAKLFIRVDEEGFLIDSLAISDVVNFDCIESIVTSAKRIISLFTDVTANEVDVVGLFYYKKRARSLRMNPVPLVTTTDGFRAIAEHPSGEIPLGVEWVKKHPEATISVLKPKAKNNVDKRSRSISPAEAARTDFSEKKRKLDAPAKYKTYMPAPSSSSSTTTSVAEVSKHIVQEEPVQSPNLFKALTENNIPDVKKTLKPGKLVDITSEDSGRRNQKQVQSNYQCSEDVSCEVILTCDGISERRKLKPSVSAVVHSLVKGNYSILRPDVLQSLSIDDRRQTNQDLLNSLNYNEDGKKSITYLNDAKTEIFKVLSLLCMSKARFKDLLDWMKNLKLEEGNQGKYYLSERNVIGGGLKVMYDSDEQTAARLNSIHRARAKAKEKTKLLHPVNPVRSAVNVGKPGDYMLVVPSSGAATAPVTTGAKPAINCKPGDQPVAVYPTITAGQPLIQLNIDQNLTAQPHPPWSKEILNKSSEPKTNFVSILNTTQTTVLTPSSVISTATKSSKPSSRHPNILRKESNFHSQKLIPPSGNPVPMHLFRSYKAGKDPENTNVDNFESEDKNDSNPAMHVLIKKEPIEHNSGNHGDETDKHSNDPPDDGSSDLNFGVIIKTEPLDDFGT